MFFSSDCGCGAGGPEAADHFGMVRRAEEFVQRQVQVIADADDGVQVQLAAAGFGGGNGGWIDVAFHCQPGHGNAAAGGNLLDSLYRVECILLSVLPPWYRLAGSFAKATDFCHAIP